MIAKITRVLIAVGVIILVQRTIIGVDRLNDYWQAQRRQIIEKDMEPAAIFYTETPQVLEASNQIKRKLKNED